MSFIGELKRRNVVKVGAAYLIVAWLLIQVASTVLPTFDAPRWAVQTLTFVVILGFPVALVLAWVYELTPEGIKRTVDVPAPQSITPATGQKLNYVIIGGLAVLLAFVVLDSYVLEKPSSPAVGGESPSAAAGSTAASALTSPGLSAPDATLANSIAVLPLENLSPDPDRAYIAAGLHEEILNQLAKLNNLTVIARTSVMQYAENKPPIDEIARALRVESIMEGSVRYAGARIRVTTQLIDSRTGAHLWSETYDREFDDIFAIESDIAMNVANAIGAEFSDAEQAAIEKPLTSSPEAYELYLQSVAVMRSGQTSGQDAANALLDRAISLDPEFARAYAQKAFVDSTTLVNTIQGAAVAPEDRAALEQRVRDNVARAIALDPEDPIAQLALRSTNVVTWHWANYVETLTPAQERVLAAGGIWVISWMGDHANALRIARRNAELDPNDSVAHIFLGVVEAYAGDRGASNRAVNRSLVLGTTNPLAHAWLAFNAVALGDHDTAAAELELVERILGANPAIVFLPEVAYAYARIGRTEDAARLFAEIERRAADADVGLGTWAMAYLAIGDEEEALRRLEAAAEKARDHEPDQGYIQLMNLKMNFLADPRLEEPRFAEVLNRIRGD
jgi:TolB-like protein/Flp pilus assembly protein TadD